MLDFFADSKHFHQHELQKSRWKLIRYLVSTAKRSYAFLVFALRQHRCGEWE